MGLQGLGLRRHELEEDLLDTYPLAAGGEEEGGGGEGGGGAGEGGRGRRRGTTSRPLAHDVLTAVVVKAGSRWSSSILSALHYQPQEAQEEEQGVGLLAESHVDRGVLTIGYSTTAGLQVGGGTHHDNPDAPVPRHQ